jgi:uncharacterized protein YjbI with pentapeptide repeats
MRKYNKSAAIYEEYSLIEVMEWINNYCLDRLNRGGNFQNADLRYADLSSADLRYANLSSADLRYANLSRTNMRHANLNSTYFQKTNIWIKDL